MKMFKLILQEFVTVFQKWFKKCCVLYKNVLEKSDTEAHPLNQM